MWSASTDPHRRPFAGLDRNLDARRFGEGVGAERGARAWGLARHERSEGLPGQLLMPGQRRVTQATPERKPERAASTDEYETPEKEELSSAPKETVTPKPPRVPGFNAERCDGTASSYSFANRREPVAHARVVETRALPRAPLKELRNPFRQDVHTEDDEKLKVEEMWDVSVSMAPLDLRNLPEVENIAPSLRNALRFLTFHECPEIDMDRAYLPEARPGTVLTVVLDLDETLMHCQKKGQPEEQPDMCLHFTDSGTTGYVRFRPFAPTFLQTLASWPGCEVVVFTASTQAYADAVLNVLDPEQQWIDHRLYRQHCVHAHGGYFKDLRALGRPMSRTVLVDNSPVSLAMNPSNGIPIKSWLSSNTDGELRALLPFLSELKTCTGSVEPHVEERYQLRAFIETLRTA